MRQMPFQKNQPDRANPSAFFIPPPFRIIYRRKKIPEKGQNLSCLTSLYMCGRNPNVSEKMPSPSTGSKLVLGHTFFLGLYAALSLPIPELRRKNG